MQDRLLTVKQVAELLQCNTDYVYKLINAGMLRALRLGRIKVRAATVNEFLATYDGNEIIFDESIVVRKMVM